MWEKGGGNLTFSAGLAAIAINGSYLCLKKASKKGTPLDWHTVASGLRNGNKREAATQEITLRNFRGTFTEPTGQPSGKQGTLTVTGEGGGWGLCRTFGVKVGLKCRGVWENVETDEERKKPLSLTGVGQNKLCVNRDVASHYNA